MKWAVCIQSAASSLIALIGVWKLPYLCFLSVWWVILVWAEQSLSLNLFPPEKKMLFTHSATPVEVFAQGNNLLWLPSFSLNKSIFTSKWEYTNSAYTFLWWGFFWFCFVLLIQTLPNPNIHLRNNERFQEAAIVFARHIPHKVQVLSSSNV